MKSQAVLHAMTTFNDYDSSRFSTKCYSTTFLFFISARHVQQTGSENSRIYYNSNLSSLYFQSYVIQNNISLVIFTIMLHQADLLYTEVNNYFWSVFSLFFKKHRHQQTTGSHTHLGICTELYNVG